MKQIAWLMGKIFTSTFKQPKNIIVYILLPLAGIIVAFIAYSQTNMETVPVGIVDHDRTPLAKDTADYLRGLDHFKVKTADEADVGSKLASGEIDVAVILEKGFSTRVMNGEPGAVTIQSVKGESVTAFIKEYLYSHIDQMAMLGQSADGDEQQFAQLKKSYDKLNFAVHQDSSNDAHRNFATTYTAIGFLIMVMLLSAANLSEIILKEKEDWTYYRLLSTPVTARDYMLANVLVNLIVMLIQSMLTLLALRLLFKINMGIPFLDLTAVLIVFSFVSVGLSLVIIAFSSSRSSAGALTNLIIIPTVLLSGSFWPVEIMPKLAQRIADFLPQRWALKTLTAMNEGSTIGELYMNFLILFAFALAFFFIAAYKFNRNNHTNQFS